MNAIHHSQRQWPSDQKILFIGSESPNTDLLVTNLASASDSKNYGLVSDPNFVPSLPGFYHTSVLDLNTGQIIKLAKHYNQVVMLDQPKTDYSHYKSLMTTVRLMQNLEKIGIKVDYKNNKISANILYWDNFLQKNKSFCFHPFLALVNDVGSTVLCPKTSIPLTKLDQIVDWKSAPEYVDIRNKMAKGELIPQRCSDCYNREAEGQESTRQYETIEWAEKLNLTSIDDFFAVEHPTFYEIRPSNKCNLMCRICSDGHSHLIEKEWKKYKTIPLVNWKFQNTPIEAINFDSAKRIYFGGGEPAIMPEFYEFLRTAIKLKRTDFELSVGTNGMKFSDTLTDLLDHFSDVNLAVSIDGYKKVNDYIRWESDFDIIVKNAHKLLERGHKINFQTVFSMWSLTRIHEVFEFIDQEFPKSGLLVQVAVGTTGIDDTISPYNHPCPELVVESMKRCQQTNSYYTNGRSVKSQVDLTLDYYSNPSYNCNVNLLRKFFDFNDKLDLYRNTRVGDYIPELEEGRKRYFK